MDRDVWSVEIPLLIMNGPCLGEYYTCLDGTIAQEKKCGKGLFYYDPCNEDTTDNDIQAKCGFGTFSIRLSNLRLLKLNKSFCKVDLAR